MVSNGVINFDGTGGITTYMFQKCVSKFVMSFSFFLPKADEACYLSTKQNANSYWRSRSHLRMQIALWKLFREHILHDWNQDNGELRWISSVIRLLNFPPFCNCFVDMRCPSLSPLESARVCVVHEFFNKSKIFRIYDISDIHGQKCECQTQK